MNIQRLLVPLKFLYRLGLDVHQRWQTRTPPYVPEVPTIGVGNLRVGGTGKTPLVLWLAEQWVRRYRVGIVTRGYRRKSKEPIWVRPGESPAVEHIGDEPFLIYRRLHGKIHLWVGSDRVEGIRRLAKAGTEVILLDDNFQDLRVHPHIQIVLLVPQDVTGGHLLPAGFLREPLSALARADLLVLNFKDDPVQEIAWEPPRPMWYLRYKVRVFRHAEQGITVPVQEFRQSRLVAVCGIADPQSFLQMLVRLGLQVVAAQTYFDHTWYSPRRLRHIRRLAERVGADTIVTTEKDWVRMTPGILPDVWFPELELEMDHGDVFFSTVAQRLGLDFPEGKAG